MAELSRITGLKVVKKVAYDTIDKAHLKKFLEVQIREEVKPSEIKLEETSLKKLGLVPANFDLAKTTVDLMTEQAAAFYDYRKKKLFLLEDSASGEQQTVLAHELAHALADQHFNLNRYLHHGKTDDSSLARMAVMEGQATWLMYEVQATKTGQSLKTSPAIAEMMSQTTDDSGPSQFPVLSGAPLYMRASLLFPYMQGLRFQQAVVLKMGQSGFGEVFRNPPVNTQQILHPELYLKREEAQVTELPEIASQKKYKTLNAGTVGEFDHTVLIEQYVGKKEARDLAPHWKAGGFQLLENKKDKNTLLLYSSEWDSAENALSMYRAYQSIMKGKWKRMQVLQEGPNFLVGEGDDGYFRLRLDGTHVTSVEGLRTLPEQGTAATTKTALRLPR
jgi:hypothetical protein